MMELAHRDKETTPVRQSVKEADDDKSTVPTNEMTRCESVSLCSVLTERPDCFELARDAGSPSRHAILYHAVRFDQDGEPEGTKDGDNETFPKLLCHC